MLIRPTQSTRSQLRYSHIEHLLFMALGVFVAIEFARDVGQQPLRELS